MQLYFIYTIISSIITFLFANLGSYISYSINKDNKYLMNILYSISSGILLSSLIISLLIPSITLSTNNIDIILGLIIGSIILFICDKFLSNKHNNTFIIILSMIIHNIPEGLCLGSSFANSYNTNTLIPSIILTISIAIQNIPEGLSITIPLKDKLSNKKIFLVSILINIIEPISSIIGYIISIKLTTILPFILSLASSTTLYILIKELIPSSQNNNNKDLMTIITILSFTIMLIFDIFLG